MSQKQIDELNERMSRLESAVIDLARLARNHGESVAEHCKSTKAELSAMHAELLSVAERLPAEP